MKLGALIAGLGVRVAGAADAWPNARTAEIRICDLTEDSRTVVPGSLFVARSGLRADGKTHIEEAARAGAVAVLTDDPKGGTPAGFDLPVLYALDLPLTAARMAERFYGEPSSRLGLVGVTGTNGKTTVTSLVWQLLNASGVRCGLVGTVLVDDGVEVAPASMTTPPAIELSRTLGLMAEAGCRAAALEVSSHALDQKRGDGLRWKVGVFTNLTGDHLDYHKTMERYAAAKARLFGLLPADGVAIVNSADAAAAGMVRGCRAPVWRCVLEAGTGADGAGSDGTGADGGGAECGAEVLEASLLGMRLRLRGPWGVVEGGVALLGRYNAMNALQAVAAAHALGLGTAAIERGLARLTAPPGRLERVSEAADEVTVFVDYAHSDDSLRSVLGAVGGLMPGRLHPGGPLREAAGAPAVMPTPGRLWVVFGCGGERDTSKRARMGLVAAELADRVVVTSDNPRTERPGEIVDQVLAGIPQAMREHVGVQVDRARAIRLAIDCAAPGDVVVIAGKGHETEQVLPDGAGGTVTTHFDDREIARQVLAERRAAAAGTATPARATTGARSASARRGAGRDAGAGRSRERRAE